MERRKLIGKINVAARESAIVIAENVTVRPAVRIVVATAVLTSKPRRTSSRNRETTSRL